MADNTSLHIAVVGGGPGGYAAAFLAADLGLKVTLIDPEVNPGGVCLYRGCIPSKALLHVAKLIEESEQAKNWGIEFSAPKIDLQKLRAWKIAGWIDRDETMIWMDGRPGPSQYAPHTHGGFTSGVWEGDALVAGESRDADAHETCTSRGAAYAEQLLPTTVGPVV